MKHRSLSLWCLLAIIFTVFSALALSVVPLGVGSKTAWWPDFVVIVVFFWMIHRPLGMPLIVVLMIGIAHDLICGGVVGAGALPLLIAAMILQPWSDPLALAAFPLRWLTFFGFAGVVAAGEWALTGIARLTPLPLGPSIAQFLVTVLAYPVVSIVFRHVLRIGRT